MRSGGELDLRYRIATPDCPVDLVHAIGHPVLKESSTPGEYVGITVDSTERRRLDQERERAEPAKTQRSISGGGTEASHRGGWAIDPVTGKIIYYWRKCFGSWGWNRRLTHRTWK